MSRRLLTGATIWAGPDCQPRRGWLLVAGDKVAGLGDQASDTRPACDEVVDLPGCHVLPGFVDVHLHLTQAAWFGQGHDGSAWRSLAEAIRAITAAATVDPVSETGSPWLLFWGAARWRWPEGRLPTAAELDQAAPGRLVLVSTADMHRGAASSAALAALGLDGRRRARELGQDVTRGRRGRPTGELWEAAYAIALQHALDGLAAGAAPAGGDRVQAVLAAEARRCLRLGITHAHDPYVPPGWHQHMVTLRAATPLRLSWATGSPAGMHCRPEGPGRVPGGRYGEAAAEVKLFADGGDRCALRLPPRAVAGLLGGAISESVRLRAPGPLREAMRRKLAIGPGGLRTPYLRYTDAELAAIAAAYLEAGIRLRIHALGNLAGEQAAHVLRTVGAPPGGATIDHLLLCDPATAERVASTGVTVSYQPGFLPRYGDMFEGARVGRYTAVLGGRLLLQAGIPLAISSDHPCGEADPLHNLRCAVHRELQPGQALTRQEALRAYTVTAAASLDAPGNGGLAPGQTADLVVCDGDPFQDSTQVTQTWIAGQIAWAPGAEPARQAGPPEP
ncbi:MAG TPA: amidohydrolase family protein [Streptosporangiaceae bacterium]